MFDPSCCSYEATPFSEPPPGARLEGDAVGKDNGKIRHHSSTSGGVLK